MANSAEIRSYGSCGLRFDATYPKRPCIESQDLGSCWWSPDLQESGGHVTGLDGKELDFTAGRRLKANRNDCGTSRHAAVIFNVVREIVEIDGGATS